jgi:hypothetical protein
VTTASTSLPMIITSRSQYASWQVCNRLRYWQHEAPNSAGGRGWQRKALGLALSTGSWCHKIAQGLLLMASGGDLRRWHDEVGHWGHPEPTNASEVLRNAVDGYRNEVQERNLEVELADSALRVAKEQAALIEAFGWAFQRVRVPMLLKQYEIVDVEREEVTLLSGDVALQSRCDAVLRRREDGRLFIWNLKTSGALSDPRWSQQYEVDAQLMTETLAVERRMGERVFGILIEGFDKGPRVKVDDRLIEVRGAKEHTQVIQRSKLLYGYKTDANPPVQPAMYDWEGTTRKGWFKFPVWKEDFCKIQALPAWGITPAVLNPISPIEWWINWLPEEVVQSHFVTLEPIMRSDRAVESCVRQIVAEEVRIRQRRQKADESPEVLDELFSQNFHSCIYPSKCGMFQICHDEGVAADIAGSGLYEPRQSNHPELEEV